MLEEFARETSAAESWSPSTRRTLSIGSRAQLAGDAVENLCERWVCGYGWCTASSRALEARAWIFGYIRGGGWRGLVTPGQSR